MTLKQLREELTRLEVPEKKEVLAYDQRMRDVYGIRSISVKSGEVVIDITYYGETEDS